MESDFSQIFKRKDAEISKLNEEIKRLKLVESSVYQLRQRLTEFDFYKQRVSELREENSRLIEEKQRIEDLLLVSRRREEDLIERLVEAQIRVDETAVEKDLQFQKSLQEEAERTNAVLQNLPTNEVVNQLQCKITELETDKEDLRSQVSDLKQGNSKEDKWKFLELQKEKIEIRRELQQVRQNLEVADRDCAAANNKLQVQLRQYDTLETTLLAERQSHNEHRGELELRIEQLTQQVMLLRRKGAKLASSQYRDLELTEMDIMFKSLQELTTQMGRLKNNNKILRKSCDKLKRDVDKIITIEDENERLKHENLELRKNLISRSTNSEQSDELQRQNLQLEIENKKLRRIVESLRSTLINIDPHNRNRYHYITSI